MSQLAALCLDYEDLGDEEPWDLLAEVTSLQHLSLRVGAGGDPSALSALTGLSRLCLESLQRLEGGRRFSFSSLQPLSTLKQLKELALLGDVAWATSLHGLAGLSNLKLLAVEFDRLRSNCARLECAPPLRSLEGINPGLESLRIEGAPGIVSWAGFGGTSLTQLQVVAGGLTSLEGLDLTSMPLKTLTFQFCEFISLSGLGHLSALKSLAVYNCNLASLQPLSQLREGLEMLIVSECSGVQEEVLELPRVQPTATVHVYCSNVREVVLAGGVRRGKML
jgi:Leucine-rich repeat (LRR) protein